MNQFYNKALTAHSQALRRNMTKEERHLWYDFLKSLPYAFRRQKTIGPYIVDFYCSSAKLVVELDGSQHFESQQQKYDQERDHYLSSLGLTVLRYTNLEITQNFNGVCQHIMNYLAHYDTSSVSADAEPPSPQGEG